MQSFLNLIDLETGRQIRLAEFGFTASEPSFCEDSIIFTRDSTLWSFDISSGMIKRVNISSIPTYAADHEISISFISDKSNEIGHCELVVDRKVIARFMGSEKSLGVCPEKDGKVVFIGYPSEDGIS